MCWLPWTMALMTGVVSAQEWSPLPEFPGQPRDDAAAFVIGTDIYVGTGMDVGFNLTNDWYRFNTLDDSWTPVAALPGSSRQYALAVSANGTGYVLGGTTGEGATDEVWSYDPSLNIWQLETPLPTAVLAATGNVCLGQVHVIGGIATDGTVAEVHQIFDPNTSIWTAAPAPPVSVHRAASFVVGSTLHVVGGATGSFEELDQHLAYDAASGQWSARAALPEGRYASDGANVHGSGVHIGGVDAGPPMTVHADVWRYHPWADSWSVLPPLPAGPRRGAVLVEVAGRLYFGTGSDATQRYRDWWTLEVPVGTAEHGSRSTIPYPVPTSGVLHLDDTLEPGDHTLRLLNSSGHEVMRWSAQERVIDMRALAAGLYVLRMEGTNSRQHRIVKTP
jgi:N-acetylneuraminic acid mutarotase